MSDGRKFSTYKMAVQVPHSIHSEVPEKDYLQSNARRYTTDHTGFV